MYTCIIRQAFNMSFVGNQGNRDFIEFRKLVFCQLDSVKYDLSSPFYNLPEQSPTQSIKSSMQMSMQTSPSVGSLIENVEKRSLRCGPM